MFKYLLKLTFILFVAFIIISVLSLGVDEAWDRHFDHRPGAIEDMYHAYTSHD